MSHETAEDRIQNNVPDNVLRGVSDIVHNDVSKQVHNRVAKRVEHLAQTIVHALLTPDQRRHEQQRWLVQLAVLTTIRHATDEALAQAAMRAASYGARYPALGRATGMSRQNARIRWPGLSNRSPHRAQGSEGDVP